MSPQPLDVEKVQAELRRFASERDWERYHTPKNLAMAICGEAGELAEIFQWLTPDESAAVMSRADLGRRVKEEISDVLIYTLRLADILGVDLARAVEEKIALNRERYPPRLARGSAEKYTRLQDPPRG